jgi:hypothetical protein
MALTCTPGGASDNCYVTLADANTYFGDRAGKAEWDAATDDQKSDALVTATRRIDEERFYGAKANPVDGVTQALKWPREGTYDDDGNEYSGTTIPERVKQAVYVYALELLAVDTMRENHLANLSFYASTTVQFKQFTPGSSGTLPADVQRLLRGLVVGGGGARLVRA